MRRLNALLLLSAWYDTERAGEIAMPVGAEYKGVPYLLSWSIQMQGARLRQIVESGTFEWPWPTPLGLVIITGAAGGGGGGGGAFCIEGLNLYGGGGGDGGGGGGVTAVTIGSRTYQAAGGNGGGGGGGGGITDGKPAKGANGLGCRYGCGGEGGRGAVVQPSPERTVSDGGDGGRGFPGETRVEELKDLSVGALFEMVIGQAGREGKGGQGYKKGTDGTKGIDGSVLFIPIFEEVGDE